jgi:NitT/TauT family transport system substrate-binding protein
MKKIRKGIQLALVSTLILVLAGCGVSKPTTEAAGTQGTNVPKQLTKVKLGYFGTTCEAPLIAAYEKGFLKEEGIDAEMIKGDANTLKDGLATGKIDATDGLLMQWLKPIESGLDIKFTAGLHTGCIQVLAPKDTPFTSFKDLKGKTIGVPAIGGGPMILVSRQLANEGLDPQKDVQWKVFPNSELPLALEKGEVDIIAVADPFAELTVSQGKVKSIYNSAKDTPFKNEYCCLLVVNGKLIEKDPETAAAITRAFLKGAKWVNTHQTEIAQIEVDKKYVPGDPALNAKILKTYNYIPSIDGGAEAVLKAAKEMQTIGVLNKDTDVEALAKASFVRLKGVQ